MRSLAERGGVEGALLVAGGEDHGSCSLLDPELPDGVAGEKRILRDAKLLQPELEALLAAGDDIQEVHDQGLGRERG